MRRVVASLMLTRAKSAHPLFVLAGLMTASLGFLALLPKIPQDQAYHLFADQRVLVGIPNFWNVVSNIPFGNCSPWEAAGLGSGRGWHRM